MKSPILYSIFVFLFLLPGSPAKGQVLHPAYLANLPQGFELLLRNRFPLTNVYEAESLLELVHVSVIDSIVEKKFQRLRFPLSPVFQALGLNWERLHEQKQRFIGTYAHHMKMYDGYKDEFDMNIFLLPHLDRYILIEAEALDLTAARPRNYDLVKAFPVDFPCPPELRYNGKCISVECEVTPSIAARATLPLSILPIDTGTHNVKDHIAFGTETPSVGVFGTWCMDCNHNCRPEIHPIEVMWWMGPSAPHVQSWNLVTFWDESKRFPDWNPSPVEATVDLPVVLEYDHAVNVYLDPVIMDGDTSFAAAPVCNSFVFSDTEDVGEGLPPKVLALYTPFTQFPAGFGMDLLVNEMPQPEQPGYGYVRLRMKVKSEFAATVRVERK